MAITPLLSSLSLVILLSILAVFHIWLNVRQPEPYMDELFHVPQAQAFCQSFITYRLPLYHPAVTTPPGIYLLPAILSFLTHMLLGDTLAKAVCSTSALRGFSALWAIGVYSEIGEVLTLLAKRRGLKPQGHNWIIALAVLFHPTLFFFAQLFYTDVASMYMILITWRLQLQGKTTLAALVGPGAVLMRQTNAVWHLFIVMDYLAFKVNFSDLLAHPSWKHLLFLAMTCLPHAFAILLYAISFYVNGGLTLGDKTNHVPVPHVVMILYFFGYCVVFGYPLIFGFRDVLCALKRLTKSKYSLRQAVLTVFIMAVIVNKFTYVHLFILSDNRHYAFYLFRKLLLRNKLTPYLPILLYWLFLMTTQNHIQNTSHNKEKEDSKLVKSTFLKDWKWSEATSELALIICAALGLVPAQLFEPRYFIVPFIFYELRSIARLRPDRNISIAATILNLVVCLLLLYVFNEMPFQREVDPHMTRDLSPGRFML